MMEPEPSRAEHTPTAGRRSGAILLELVDAQVCYERGLPGERRALAGVTLNVQAGDRVALMGRAGAGKTTLLHVLSRLLKLDGGELRTQGKRLPSLVFQFPERQLFAETVRQEVGYGLREGGVRADEVEARVRQALDDVGLAPDEFAPRFPFHLSAGEKRRVALACALAQQRSLVLLDEPTLGLDAEGSARLTGILERLAARGVAYWIATHDADFVTATCAHVVILDGGRIVFQGESEKLWSDPRRLDSFGVRMPRLAALRETLRASGVPHLTARAGLPELVTALVGMWHRHGPHPS